MKRNTVVLVLIVGFFGLGIYIGYHNRPQSESITDVTGKDVSVDSGAKVDFSDFWKAWNLIDEKYPNASSVSSQDRVYGAISGLVGSLNDPYSVFFDPDEAKIFQGDITGNFSGVGMEVGIKDKVLTVIAPLKDTPADKAGIKSGDKILKIDKADTSDMSIDKAISLIRGDKGTAVTLTILSEGDSETHDVKIVRDTITTPTLDTEQRSDGIFVIRLYSFSADSASLFRQAMQKFIASKSDKLILDLRGNPGGYLDAAVDISSWFLDKGQVVVTEDYGNNQKANVYRSKGYNPFGDSLKFVILINGGSASASEIVSGAMQDHGKAKLVGTQSYGKGSVQEVIDLTPDTLLKVTVARWLTPNGTSISLKGLTPDYPVNITKDDVTKQKDPQMDKAVELLNNWTPIAPPAAPAQ